MDWLRSPNALDTGIAGGLLTCFDNVAYTHGSSVVALELQCCMKIWLETRIRPCVKAQAEVSQMHTRTRDPTYMTL